MGERSAEPLLTDYLDTFAANLDRFRISPDDHPEQSTGEAWGRLVLNRTDSLLPYRDEAVDVFEAVALAGATDEAVDALRRFFERVAALFEAVPRDLPQRGRLVFEHEADSFRLLWWELFLYAVAALLARERYEAIGRLTGTRYLLATRGRRLTVSFAALQEGSDVLKAVYRNPNGSEPLSPVGKYLMDRATRDGLDHTALLEADSVLYVNGQVREMVAKQSQSGYGWSHWYAATSPYMERSYDPYPVFLRAEHEMGRVLPAFGTCDENLARAVFAKIQTGGRDRSARALASVTNAQVLGAPDASVSR